MQPRGSLRPDACAGLGGNGLLNLAPGLIWKRLFYRALLVSAGSGLQSKNIHWWKVQRPASVARETSRPQAGY
jgi:hypothetical protein